MGKNNYNAIQVTQECQNMIGLLRGGMPLYDAASAVGLSYGQAQYQLKMSGMSALSVRASGNTIKDGNVEPVLEAIDMMLNGAAPEVVLCATGVTVKQIKLRIEEMAAYGCAEDYQYESDLTMGGVRKCL